MTDCFDFIRSAWEPPSILEIDRWIEANIELGGDSDLQGRVSFDLFPMVRFFLRKCADPKVRSVTLICSAQSAKTKSVEFFLIWKLINDPAAVIWYEDTQESAKEFSQTRLYNDLHGCELVRDKLPADRHRQKWALIQFDDMDLHVLGANTKRNRERISAEVVLCDERRNYPRGAMSSIRNRYKTFRRSKEISFSTAGHEFDELHLGFLNGTMHFFHWACLSCGHRQPFRFGRKANPMFTTDRECGGVIWENSKVTRPSEHVWNIAEVRKTVRYQCENPTCKREYRNAEKPLLMATMTEDNNWGAVQTNPMASPEHVSMFWNELYMPFADTSWEMTAEKFLKANVNFKRTQNREPLNVVIQESFGEPLREDSEKVEAQQVLERQGTYLIGEKWVPEISAALILTFDKQMGHVVFVVRQWQTGGASRLIECGQVPDFETLRGVQSRLGIKDKCVWGDCAYEPDKVFSACHSYCWLPLIGSDRPEFQNKVWNAQEKKFDHVKAYWRADTFRTRYGLIKRFVWSNDHYMDQLYLFLIPGGTTLHQLGIDADGSEQEELRHLAPVWEIPSDKPYDYVQQLSAVERVKEVDADGVVSYRWRWTGRHDYADCELMQVVVADQSGLFISTAP